MLCQYLDPSEWGRELILTYAKLLLFEMLGCEYEYEETARSRHFFQLARILTRIDQDYRTVSLESLAEELGYNSSYLSRMVRKGTGKKFKDLLMERRMKQSAILLKNTQLPVHEIMLQTGMVNETFL